MSTSGRFYLSYDIKMILKSYFGVKTRGLCVMLKALFQNVSQKSVNHWWFINVTVDSEIFAKVLFSRNFAYAKFCENKTLAKWQNHSVVYRYRYIMPKSRISNVANMPFNAIRENKILAKISGFTVMHSVISLTDAPSYDKHFL